MNQTAKNTSAAIGKTDLPSYPRMSVAPMMDWMDLIEKAQLDQHVI